jgi:hypothetical protein
MVIFTLVDDVQKVMDSIRKQYGEFTLVMLYNSGSLQIESNWNLIISAPWADKIGITEATRMVAHALSEGLEFQDKHAISRVTVLKTSDPFVRDILDLYPGATSAPVHQVTAGQVSEGSGFILYSRRAA